MLDEAAIRSFFDDREKELIDPARRTSFSFGSAFRASLPDSGGTYLFFQGRSIVYIGETRSLRQRLGTHMRNPENHVLSLKVARLLHDRIHGDGAAGSMRKFAEAHKKATRAWFETNLTVSYVSLLIGRRELEERLVEAYRPRFNDRYPALQDREPDA